MGCPDSASGTRTFRLRVDRQHFVHCSMCMVEANRWRCVGRKRRRSVGPSCRSSRRHLAHSPKHRRPRLPRSRRTPPPETGFSGVCGSRKPSGFRRRIGIFRNGIPNDGSVWLGAPPNLRRMVSSRLGRVADDDDTADVCCRQLRVPADCHPAGRTNDTGGV